MNTWTGILAAVALLAGNAFFVGAEFALVSARRTQIEPRARAGSRTAKVTLRAMEQVSLMMAGAQLGITACSLGLGAVGEPTVAHLIAPAFDVLALPVELLHVVAFTIAMAIVVSLHMVLGEMVPKNLALAGPTRCALLLGPAHYGFVWLLRPLVVGLNAFANGVLRAVRVEPIDEVASAYSREQVAGLAAESRREGLLAETEHILLSGALEFEQRTVRDVMTPARALVTVPVGATCDQIEHLSAATGYSRFPVTGRDGEPSGYLHIKDIVETDHAKRTQPVAEKRVRPLSSVRTTDSLHTAMTTMRRSRTLVARVITPAGSSVGAVFLEDVLEALIGEVQDATHQVRGATG